MALVWRIVAPLARLAHALRWSGVAIGVPAGGLGLDLRVRHERRELSGDKAADVLAHVDAEALPPPTRVSRRHGHAREQPDLRRLLGRQRVRPHVAVRVAVGARRLAELSCASLPRHACRRDAGSIAVTRVLA
eukprot:6092827-Pleurochrysis_carterae.AAC.4